MNQNDQMRELEPCPFCGSTPEFPEGIGTQYEIECNDCCQSIVGIQICDLMTLEERSTETFENYRYSPQYVERAKQEAIKRWNTRAHVNETPKSEHDGGDVLTKAKDADHVGDANKMVRPSDEKIWALWHELPNQQGKYAIARFAEEIMDEMERLNK